MVLLVFPWTFNKYNYVYTAGMLQFLTKAGLFNCGVYLLDFISPLWSEKYKIKGHDFLSVVVYSGYKI